MNLKSSGPSYLKRVFLPVITLACLDVQNAATAGAATLKAATATVTAAVTLTDADLLANGKTALAACPRQVRFTTAGGTPAHAPASATITGWVLGKGRVVEVVALAQTATTADSTYFFTKIDSIAYTAGDGTDATVAIGFTTALGLPAKLKGRGAAGAVLVIHRELVDGAAPTAGSLTAAATHKPFGSYTPHATAVPDAARDHLVFFECDAEG